MGWSSNILSTRGLAWRRGHLSGLDTCRLGNPTAGSSRPCGDRIHVLTHLDAGCRVVGLSDWVMENSEYCHEATSTNKEPVVSDVYGRLSSNSLSEDQTNLGGDGMT